MPSALISTRELAARLGDVTILDVRWRLGGPPGHEEFLRGHVPGASYVELGTDLADPPGPRGRHPLPEDRRFLDAMRRAGVSNGRPVVVYDDVFGTTAARAWWLLRYYGHPDVRVLDGGYTWWVKDGFPVEEGDPERPPGDFAGEPGHLPVLDAAGAGRVAREGVLVDARAAERFRGEVEPVDPVAGHIPGAVNVPTHANLVYPGSVINGRFKPGDDLVFLYEHVGVRPDSEVGVYCGSGVNAAHDILALELIGVSAALYPGSWSEWVTDPTRPVATGGA
jgi:thiosulfate/3-mercaptopyruvate sulfurtransferase